MAPEVATTKNIFARLVNAVVKRENVNHHLSYKLIDRALDRVAIGLLAGKCDVVEEQRPRWTM